jgi:hypothetical protein
MDLILKGGRRQRSLVNIKPGNMNSHILEYCGEFGIKECRVVIEGTASVNVETDVAALFD